MEKELLARGEKFSFGFLSRVSFIIVQKSNIILRQFLLTSGYRMKKSLKDECMRKRARVGIPLCLCQRFLDRTPTDQELQFNHLFKVISITHKFKKSYCFSFFNDDETPTKKVRAYWPLL